MSDSDVTAGDSSVDNVPRRQWLEASLGVAFALFGAMLFRAATSPTARDFILGRPTPSTAAQLVAEHLQWADNQANAGLDPHLAPIREFFAVARQRTRAYATDVLGWQSKLTLAADYVTGQEAHARFLQAKFAETLFTDEELEALLQQAVMAYLAHLDDVESQLLVNLEADLAGLPAGALPQLVDRSELAAVLHAALDGAADSAVGEFQGMIGRELVSFVTSEVLTLVATQLATSAGILGTGAASGWATFGIGVGIGFLVDAAITDAYNRKFDPAGTLSTQLDESLTRMEAVILDGTSESAGLRSRLSNYSAQRSALRRQAIEQVVCPTMAL